MWAVLLLAGWIVASAITGLALGLFFRRAGWKAASQTDWARPKNGSSWIKGRSQ